MDSIRRLIWTPERESHVLQRHGLLRHEVEEACFGNSMVVGVRDGLHGVFGQSDAGRYLFVVVAAVGQRQARVVTARDMTVRERRYFLRRGK